MLVQVNETKFLTRSGFEKYGQLSNNSRDLKENLEILLQNKCFYGEYMKMVKVK